MKRFCTSPPALRPPPRAKGVGTPKDSGEVTYFTPLPGVARMATSLEIGEVTHFTPFPDEWGGESS